MRNSLVALTLLSMSSPVFAREFHGCLSNDGQPLPVNNSEVVAWKKTGVINFTARARVTGTISSDSYQGREPGKQIVAIDLDGMNGKETVAVYYDEDFGPLPKLNMGDRIEACGDFRIIRYIGYSLPSSRGATLQWTHYSPSKNHSDGYLQIEGRIFGQ